MHKAIYLDYMSTTPVDPRVIKKMLQFMGPNTNFGNPASVTHSYGLNAACAIDNARLQIASLIGASPEDIIFTSGATEANNLAIFGAARFYKIKGKHLITLTTEHKSVLDCFKQLEREDFEVTYLNPNKDGILDLSILEKSLRQDTILVSIMHVNNEIGVIQDIAAISELLKNKGIIFHVDAAQSAGKISIDLSKTAIDLMSFSAHKLYGPKGVGALFVRHKPRIRLQPILFGGGQEHGIRSGTLPTHQIVGMGEAFTIAKDCFIEEQAHILILRKKFWNEISLLPNVSVNGSLDKRIAGNLNVKFEGLEGKDLLTELSELAVSNTSACVAQRNQASHVLKAIGLTTIQALNSIRFSFGRYTTNQDIDKAIDVIKKVVQ